MGTHEGNGGGQQSGTNLENLPADSVYKLAKAGTIKRWDSINYDPGDGTISSLLDTNNQPLAGTSLSGTISASSAQNWVVLDVTNDGEVLIMPKTVSENTLDLRGKDGYNNAIVALDMVASIYKNDTYAQSVRSIRIEDVNKVANYTPNGVVFENTFNSRHGMNLDVTSENYLDVTDSGSYENRPNRTFVSTATTGTYGYYCSSFGGMPIFWLASRAIEGFENSDNVLFCVRQARWTE